MAALERGLSDSEPLVRGASAWALGRHPFTGVASTLEQQLSSDGDPDVCEEIQQALNELAKSGGVGPVK